MPMQTRFKEEVLELQQQVQAIQHGQDQLQAVTGARQSINGLELANSISHWQERFNSLAEVIKEVDATVEGTLRVVLGDLGTGEPNSSTLAVPTLRYGSCCIHHPPMTQHLQDNCCGLCLASCHSSSCAVHSVVAWAGDLVALPSDRLAAVSMPDLF